MKTLKQEIEYQNLKKFLIVNTFMLLLIVLINFICEIFTHLKI